MKEALETLRNEMLAKLNLMNKFEWKVPTKNITLDSKLVVDSNFMEELTQKLRQPFSIFSMNARNSKHKRTQQKLFIN